MQEHHGVLASGNRFRVTPYLLEVFDATGTPIHTIDIQEIASVTRSGTTVTLKNHAGETFELGASSLDDAGRTEMMLRSSLPIVATPIAVDTRGTRGQGLRIATMIIALALMGIVFLQSCVASVGGSVGDDEDLSGAAAFGVLVSFLYLLGGAFALSLPRVAMIMFILAAILGILVGATSDFGDLIVWGVIAAALAVMAYFGARGKRQSRAS